MPRYYRGSILIFLLLVSFLLELFFLGLYQFSQSNYQLLSFYKSTSKAQMALTYDLENNLEKIHQKQCFFQGLSWQDVSFSLLEQKKCKLTFNHRNYYFLIHEKQEDNGIAVKSLKPKGEFIRAEIKAVYANNISHWQIMYHVTNISTNATKYQQMVDRVITLNPL